MAGGLLQSRHQQSQAQRLLGPAAAVLARPLRCAEVCTLCDAPFAVEDRGRPVHCRGLVLIMSSKLAAGLGLFNSSHARHTVPAAPAGEDCKVP